MLIKTKKSYGLSRYPIHTYLLEDVSGDQLKIKCSSVPTGFQYALVRAPGYEQRV
jgi:hypothetical protein